MQITDEELLSIARISQLRLRPEELDTLRSHIAAVLSYSARVQEVSADASEFLVKAVNVTRQDVPVCSDAAAIRARAPREDHHYFVVPKVI